jgi:hypothetical protein
MQFSTSILEGSSEIVYVCILANSEDEKKSVLRKIQSIVERIPGSEKSANINFIFEHFTCLVFSTFDEKCGEHGQISISYKNEAKKAQGDFERTSEAEEAQGDFERTSEAEEAQGDFERTSEAEEAQGDFERTSEAEEAQGDFERTSEQIKLESSTSFDLAVDKEFRQPRSKGKSEEVTAIRSSVSGFLRIAGAQDSSSSYYVASCGHQIYPNHTGIEINLKDSCAELKEDIVIHWMWPAAMKISDEEKTFSAFFNPSQLLTVDKETYYSNKNQKVIRQCVSDVSAISLRKISPSDGNPVVFAYSKKCRILEWYQNIRNTNPPVSLSSIPHFSEYRGVVSCKLKDEITVHVDIIGLAHRCFREVGSSSGEIYEVFYVGNLKKDGREYACFDDGDSGSPCMTEDGRIHSFVTSNSHPHRYDGNYDGKYNGKSFSFLTPAHFACSQAVELVGSKLEFVDGSFSFQSPLPSTCSIL